MLRQIQFLFGSQLHCNKKEGFYMIEENTEHDSIKFWRDKCHYYEILYKKYKILLTEHRLIIRQHLHMLQEVEVETRKELRDLGLEDIDRDLGNE